MHIFITSLNRFFGIILLLFFAYSCQTQQDKLNEKIGVHMQKVIDIHDEIMPKMMTISGLIENIEPQIDASTHGKLFEKTAKKLQYAQGNMMKWMQNFSDKFPEGKINKIQSLSELDTQLKSIQGELVKLEDLRALFESSIAEAKSLLKN